MTIVKICLEFPVPEREGPGNFTEESEELWNLWEQLVRDPSRIPTEIIDMVEAEFSGLADYGTVKVTSVVIVP